jgi:hypothetical protein
LVGVRHAGLGGVPTVDGRSRDPLVRETHPLGFWFVAAAATKSALPLYRTAEPEQKR